MKTLTLYLPLSVLLYLVISFSSSFTIEYLAFSKLVYLGIALIGTLSTYLVIMIYRQKKCFSFNKYASILTVFILCSLSTYEFIDNTHNIEKVFKHQVLSLNKNLPIMIDKNTRFDRVYFKDDNICYEYTLVNVNSKSINKDFITLALTDKIYSQNSLDKTLLKLSKKTRVINYIFHDKEKNFLTKVELKLK